MTDEGCNVCWNCGGGCGYQMHKCENQFNKFNENRFEL